MGKIGIVLIGAMVFLLSCTVPVHADKASKARYVKRIAEEIRHKNKMKELELEYKIYCKEIELQKEDINIDVSTHNNNVIKTQGKKNERCK